MAGIHRERPGAEAIAPSTGEPAVDLGDGIWLSPGLSNSYSVSRFVTDTRNSGLGFSDGSISYVCPVLPGS